MDPERLRLEEDKNKSHYWKRWGPYVSGRQWGSVREDYSETGDAWSYFPFEEASYRAYRWGEDGIGGICDNHQRICFALTLWNQKDPILKERFFGLIPSQGNHGEDVKELYYHLDNTPTHSYMKFLYKYPHGPFPYEELIKVNHERGKTDPEFEIYDTNAFDENRYFDVFIEYAKGAPEDLWIRITVENRFDEDHPLDLIPTLWARNTWVWSEEEKEKPHVKALPSKPDFASCHVSIPDLKERILYAEGNPELLFTENETNLSKFDQEQNHPYAKDGIQEFLIHGKKDAINPKKEGTKMGCLYRLNIPGQSTQTIYLRLTDQLNLDNPFDGKEELFKKRKEEADLFYAPLLPENLTKEARDIERQAFAGMLWNKQFYHYVIEAWLKGEKVRPPDYPPRTKVRNARWVHIYSEDVLSIPDKWEYPWFAVWDNAFHTYVLSLIDPELAKAQLIKLTREWYMNPNGQLPAYEWNFSDVNPPVHAWAIWRVYKIEKKATGQDDLLFLERVFQKLIMNFTWWINRKDSDGKNVFQGGFLGMDNISVFNRSENLPKNGSLYQSDATSWMGTYCLNMLTIALELAKTKPAYEDIASKFYLHFLHIADAINFTQEDSFPLWNEEDGFFYDVFQPEESDPFPIQVRSMVGLVPLLSVATLSAEDLNHFPGFKSRMDWYIEHRSDLCGQVACMKTPGVEGRRILAILGPERLKRVLEKLLDEEEFLSPYGIRSVSKYHEKHPYELEIDGKKYSVNYEPAESTTDLFGGNSNWRGPIWFPLNILIIESLQKYHYYYGDDFRVECPKGSGKFLNLWDVACTLSHRLLNLFLKDEKGHRPIYAQREKFQNDPHFKDYILFNEYFHGDTGEGLGASHQTGWTGLIAKLIKQLGDYEAF